ncbi:MAG: shikimate dehydrogenase [Candidatus Dormibacteria bacterium]
MTRQLGLIGSPVGHSPSAAMHRAAFSALGLDWDYRPIEVAAGDLPRAWAELRASLLGANVTIPHKMAAADLADRLTPEARASGSVNTLVFAADGVVGATTDGKGFLRALTAAGLASPGRALILGAGGASRAVAQALLSVGCEVTITARRLEQALKVRSCLAESVAAGVRAIAMEAEPISAQLAECDLLVNATPLGSQFHLDLCALPVEVRLEPGLTVFDLVYSPQSTELIRRAARAGCRTLGGLDMLVQQAALSLEIWSGLPAPVGVMREAAIRHLDRGPVAP